MTETEVIVGDVYEISGLIEDEKELNGTLVKVIADYTSWIEVELVPKYQDRWRFGRFNILKKHLVERELPQECL